MLSEIDKRLNKLFETHENIRKAELTGDRQSMTRWVNDGLATSCLFLRDMLGDGNLTALKGDAAARATLRKLHHEKKLDAFLAFERKLLAMTKLEPRVVDELVGALGRIGSSSDPTENWQGHLQEFCDVVCRAAKGEAADARQRPLIRRVFLGGGGAMIALLNTFPPIPIPPPWAPASITGGVWLIEKALESEVDDFLNG